MPPEYYRAVIFSPATACQFTVVMVFTTIGKVAFHYESRPLLLASFAILILATVLNVAMSTFPKFFAIREAAYRNRHFSAYMPGTNDAQFVEEPSSIPGLWFVTLDNAGRRKTAPIATAVARAST